MIIFRTRKSKEEITHKILVSETEVRQLFNDDRDYALMLFAMANQRDNEELKIRSPKKVRLTSVCKEAGITINELRQIIKKSG